MADELATVETQVLRIATRRVAGAPVVTLSGEIDVLTAAGLRVALARAVSVDGAGVLLDMRGVTFIDSTGIRTLLEAARDAESRAGGLSLLISDGPVSRVFDLMGLREWIDVRDAESLPGS